MFWINTTQISEKDPRTKEEKKAGKKLDKPLGVDPELNPIIEHHNAMAAEVMAQEKVPVIDFYNTLLPHMQWVRGDRFHWQTPAYKLMAKTLAKAIEPDLKPTAGK